MANCQVTKWQRGPVALPLIFFNAISIEVHDKGTVPSSWRETD